MYSVKIYKEDEIPWELQNKLHRLLNITFKGRSIKFVAKTYANIRPDERIIYFDESETPIAHLGIHYDVLHIGKISVDVACMGLWCAVSNSKRLAIQIMKTAYEYLCGQGVGLGLGVTSSQVILKYVLPEFKHAQLDISLKGQTTSSKPIDKVLFFSIGLSDDQFQHLSDAAIIEKVIDVDSEVF